MNKPNTNGFGRSVHKTTPLTVNNGKEEEEDFEVLTQVDPVITKVVYCNCQLDGGVKRTALINECKEEGNPNKGRQYYHCSLCRFFQPKDEGYEWIRFNRTAEMEKARRDRKRLYSAVKEPEVDNLERAIDIIHGVETKLEYVERRFVGIEEKLKKLCARFNIPTDK